ncbi:MAG TPA: Fe-S cluster assembly protein SufD [Acidimicrobiales bacterium]|jgi:Fe-S cluster assembly protein SufD|nr:Fe-S cluster assembly protein SufD [Acidimicrobiales bacterium]
MSTFTAAVASALRGPDWLRARRAAAAERFAALSLPTESEEIWRYSRISSLDLDAYAPADPTGPSAGGDGTAILAQLEPVIALAGDRAAVAVAHNGRLVHVEVDPALAARGLVVADIAGLDDGEELLDATAPDDRDAFGELNDAFFDGVVVVRVPAGLDVDRPVVVFHWIDGEGLAVFPRTLVDAGPDSGVTVLEHQGSADVAAFVDPVVEVRAAQAARVSYLNLQDLGPRVWQVGHQLSDVGRDATLHSSVVALGGSYARVRTDSRISGQGGTAELTAVYFADGDRMHDFRTLQDHAAPSSTSDLLFKGAVQDRGRSVYSGLIRVRKEARGTNAFQTNRNLVLTEGAEASSVPNLEIDTNDVKCSHASAVGPIDEDQRYYLETRGIPPAVVERLIVLGFFGEVLDRLPTPSLVGSLRNTLAGRLATGRS